MQLITIMIPTALLPRYLHCCRAVAVLEPNAAWLLPVANWSPNVVCELAPRRAATSFARERHRGESSHQPRSVLCEAVFSPLVACCSVHLVPLAPGHAATEACGVHAALLHTVPTRGRPRAHSSTGGIAFRPMVLIMISLNVLLCLRCPATLQRLGRARLRACTCIAITLHRIPACISIQSRVFKAYLSPSLFLTPNKARGAAALVSRAVFRAERVIPARQVPVAGRQTREAAT